MTQTPYVQHRKVLSIEGGKAKVWQGAGEMELELTDWEGKKVLAGGLGASTYVTNDLRALMVRTEWRTIKGFLKMKQRMHDERIPIIREEIRMEIVRKFGTLDTTTLLSRLYKEMIDNPRISVKTRRGQTIRTTLSEQKRFTAERNASVLEGKKR